MNLIIIIVILTLILANQKIYVGPAACISNNSINTQFGGSLSAMFQVSAHWTVSLV